MNIKKIIIIIIVLLILNVLLSYKTFALSKIIDDGNDFLSGGAQDVVDESKLKETNSKIYRILLGIGIAVAVIIGAVLGVSFIFASVEGKAKISEALVPYIVGCFIVFGAFIIWKLAVNTGNSITNSTSTTSMSGGTHTSSSSSTSTHGGGGGGF